MSRKTSIVKHESTQVILKKAQSLMDITNSILKNSKRDLVKKENSQIIAIDEKFVLIKAGSFMMGSNEYENRQPIHKITIDYDFYISKYQVTMKEYLEFVNSTNSNHPIWIETDYHFKDQNFNNDAPIMGVSWKNAKAYCKWRSKKEEKTYRLPTEAEWEYACRAGSTTKWSFGDDDSKLEEYAWYSKNSNGKAHPVGDKKPNPWGLYDMHGNVWEWCEDDGSDNYDTTPRGGSANKSNNSGEKVLRGGSWVNPAYGAHSSFRFKFNPSFRINDVGFRLLRTLSY